jgi:hypothetical protein
MGPCRRKFPLVRRRLVDFLRASKYFMAGLAPVDSFAYNEIPVFASDQVDRRDMSPKPAGKGNFDHVS